MTDHERWEQLEREFEERAASYERARKQAANDRVPLEGARVLRDASRYAARRIRETRDAIVAEGAEPDEAKERLLRGVEYAAKREAEFKRMLRTAYKDAHPEDVPADVLAALNPEAVGHPAPSEDEGELVRAEKPDVPTLRASIPPFETSAPDHSEGDDPTPAAEEAGEDEPLGERLQAAPKPEEAAGREPVSDELDLRRRLEALLLAGERLVAAMEYGQFNDGEFRNELARARVLLANIDDVEELRSHLQTMERYGA